MGDLQNGGQLQQLRLKAVAQDPSVQGSAASASKTSTASVTPAAEGDSQLAASSRVSGTETLTASSLMSGIEVAPQQPQGDVQVFEQDNADGTICDCGEIPAVGGGFPKWPFLALIPLICVTGVCTHHEKPPPPETPTPTPPVPEPASLLLFGSGIVALSASARRRYAKIRASKQAAAMTEE
jgi:hypothetical protein